MTDILLDQDGDIQINADDLVLGISDQQHKEHLLLTEKGAVKQYPEAGVGVFKFLESDEPSMLLREVSIQFTADGMKVEKVGFTNEGLNIKADYQ